MKSVITAMAAAILLMSSSAQSSEFWVAMLKDFPPHQYVEDGEIKGADVDIIREIGKRMNLDIKFVALPWKRVLLSAKKGSVSAVLAVLQNRDRAKFIRYPTVPIHMNRNSIVIRKGDPIHISSLDDLHGLKIGVTLGYSYGQEFDRIPGLIKTEVNGQKQLVRMLEIERIDAAIVIEAPFYYNAKQLGFQDRFETAYVFSETPAYTGLSIKGTDPNTDQIADDYARILRELIENGFVEETLRKYVR